MEYTTTSFGVNIGTGLMLESILAPMEERIDSDRKIPNQVNLSDYKHYYINVDSLLSNIIGSYDKDTITSFIKGSTKIDSQIYEKLIEEMLLIKQILPIEVIYYKLSYDSYSKNKLLVEDGTSKKAQITRKINIIIKKLLNDKSSGVEILTGDVRLGNKTKSLISTSKAIDLLNDNTSELHLLEFHTGVLKKRNQFYTKLKVKDKMPFEEIILIAVGDKNGMLQSPLSRKDKNLFIQHINEKKLKNFVRYQKSFILKGIASSEISSKLMSIKTQF